MSDASQRLGWWIASDGAWYPPELHPAIPTPPQVSNYQAVPEAAVGGTGPEPSVFSGLPGFPPLPPPGGSGSGFPAPYGAAAAAPSVWGPPGVGYGYPAPRQSTNGLAIASLVLSIVSVVGIGSILGIIFGFVARGQIERSRGSQKGAGLALAGIIVGFVTLALVLFAVAIPTFLGVRAASNDLPVTHLPPTSIVLGQPIEGARATPVPWQPEAESDGVTLSTAPNGVNMTMPNSGQADWASVPAPGAYPSMQLSASVALTSGPQTNSIGLACLTASKAEQLIFVIHGSGLWQVALLTYNGETLIDSGVSSVIHPTGSNALTIACDNDATVVGRTHLMFEINQTPVANDVVQYSSAEWFPALQLCSCDGPSTGSFANVAYYGPPGASSP